MKRETYFSYPVLSVRREQTSIAVFNNKGGVGKTTLTDAPLHVTKNWGDGRVFYLALGHDAKACEHGTDTPESFAEPLKLRDELGLIPGRLSIHTYEDKIASRWTDVYGGDPLAIRTVTQIRNFCEMYAKNYAYDYVVIDTSPSLGILNKVIISTVDGFLIPCMPDMFSLYGIQHIGKSLKGWKRDFNTIFTSTFRCKIKLFP